VKEDDVPTMRSKQELHALRAEAERRVRAGENQSEVARSLGLGLTTVTSWALRYGWRKKDLEAECEAELAEAVAAQIAAARPAHAPEGATDGAGETGAEAQETAGAPEAGGNPIARAMAQVDRLLAANRLAEADRAASVAVRMTETMDC
jgi:uncharacterized protein YjcR